MTKFEDAENELLITKITSEKYFNRCFIQCLSSNNVVCFKETFYKKRD